MRVVIQRVSQASVVVENRLVSSIKTGYMLLVGISADDTIAEVEKSARKVAAIRLFPDDSDGQWKKCIKDIGGEVLSVSQFTLMARTKKGTKPDFHEAQKGHLAKELYDRFLELLRHELGEQQVQDGEFGAMMSCSLTNEGPVTIILDTNEMK
ncbi:AaceriABL152Wp [[Ashbya] aceris (nom. inval.)]|nr:AaceriABL152Wp [[Ashbya] aceris (nom. inval.)]